jgi:hypothetical protein
MNSFVLGWVKLVCAVLHLRWYVLDYVRFASVGLCSVRLIELNEQNDFTTWHSTLRNTSMKVAVTSPKLLLGGSERTQVSQNRLQMGREYRLVSLI